MAKFFWVIFLPVVSSGVLLRVHPDGPDDERKSTFIFFLLFQHDSSPPLADEGRKEEFFLSFLF